jgi:S-adenosylmethionine hydrolase
MVIALLTDFGTQDYFVGAMKGTILQINKEAVIVDISHEIPPQNISAGSFILRACYRNFPSNTIFVTVVDPGVGSERRAILAVTKKYFFIAPDNGLLDFVFQETDSFRIFELTERKYFAPEVSATFHGRDIFAPVAAHLSCGISPTEFGPEIFRSEKPEIEYKQPQIIHIDRFGNIITNLKKEDLPPGFTLEIGGRAIKKLQKFYAEAEKDEVFMIFGSAGYLEIAAFQNSAAKILAATVGQKITVKT